MRTFVVLFALLVLPAAVAQPAPSPENGPPADGSLADAYHSAAQLYIDGDGEQAEAVAMDALAQAPNPNTPVHPKLEALLELIRQQQQDPQQGSDGDESEQENGQDGENEDAQNQQGGGESEQQDQQDSQQGEQEPSEDGQPQPGDASENDEGEPEDQQRPEFEDENNEAESDATNQQPTDPQEQDEEGQSGTSGDLEDGEETDGEGTPTGTAEVLPGTMSEAEALRILGALEADEEELLQEVQQRRAPPRRVEKDW